MQNGDPSVGGIQGPTAGHTKNLPPVVSPQTDPMQSPRIKRALLLSGLFSEAGQGQVLFLGPGQFAPAVKRIEINNLLGVLDEIDASIAA